MRKFRSQLSATELSELKRLSELDFAKYNETEVREEYIRPLLTLLGYRKENDYAVSTETDFKLHKAFLRVGSKRIRLDYISNIRKQYFWLIEAKDGNPEHRGGFSEADVAQAYFYSLHPEINCRYFAVCNGWLINLYDRDKLDDKYTPILSIRHVDLPTHFLTLDSFIGSTQIVANSKVRLLDQIESVLSAEIALDRLDEFAYEVQQATWRARPKVLENFRANARKVDSEQQVAFEKMLTEFTPYQIVETFFMSTVSVRDVHKLAAALVAKIKTTPGHSNHFLLFDKIFLNQLRPVRYWYYINCLNFLLTLDANGIENVDYPMHGQQKSKIRDLVHQYLRDVFTRFNSRRDIRLLTLFEAAFMRTYKRLLIISPNARELILRTVELSRYYLPEENVAWFGPHAARSMLQFVDSATMVMCGETLGRWYDSKNRRAKLELAKQELSQLTRDFDALKLKTDATYKSLKDELGQSWSDMGNSEILFIHWDPVISAALELLEPHQNIVESLPDDIKHLISHVLSIGCVGLHSKFEEKYDFKKVVYDEPQRQVLVDEFFSVDYQPAGE